MSCFDILFQGYSPTPRGRKSRNFPSSFPFLCCEFFLVDLRFSLLCFLRTYFWRIAVFVGSSESVVLSFGPIFTTSIGRRLNIC
ncbi:hypothetical protein GPALN_014872 [Globodera pallida]|nr:hypothetical protein GPALN_014872 [Globodera pallida]